MKMFNLKETCLSLTTGNIVSLISSIEMHRGKSQVALQQLKKIEDLRNVARRSGVISSQTLGNVFLTDDEEKDLFEKRKAPETFQQHMVKGYNEALDLIDQVYKFQPFDRSFVCTLHYYMYKDYNPEFGGKFKDTQNYIQELLPDGSYRTVFVPSAPEEVVSLLDNLIYQFNECAADEQVNKLVLIAAFILDFLCIHPFNHGNGRTSRLILNFLLKKFGFDIDDYFSIAYLLKVRISDYIDVFEASSKKWEDNENNYEPYVTFMLRTILDAYKKVDYIIDINLAAGTTEEKILKIINQSATPISKQVVQSVLYAASATTIEKGLAGLLKEGRIQIITRGRYAKYFRV